VIQCCDDEKVIESVQLVSQSALPHTRTTISQFQGVKIPKNR